METTARGDVVVVVGMGHVGAPLAAAIAAAHHVVGVDRDATRLSELERLEGLDPPLVEAFLEARTRGALKLSASSPRGAIKALIVAIEPSQVSELIGAIEPWLDRIEPGGGVVIASTCRPGWFKPLIEALGARLDRLDLRLAHAPERMMPGRALEEVVGLRRVIGGRTPRCAEWASALYVTFTHAPSSKATGLEHAAMSKIAENAYRAVNVVLANELGRVAARYGVSAAALRELANEHPRVALHEAGLGAWGRCLPLAMGLLAEEGSELARSALRLNQERPEALALAIASALAGVQGARVAVLGVTYKPESEDARCSGAVELIEALRRRGLQVTLYDPHLSSSQRAHYGASAELTSALTGAHAAIVATRHEAFAHLSDDALRARLIEPAQVWRADTF